MLAVVSGIFEKAVQQKNDDGKYQTSIIINQIGEEEKPRIKVADDYVLPVVGEVVDIKVNIKKGVWNGKQFVSVRAV